MHKNALRVQDAAVVAVLSGVDRLDTERLRAHYGAARVERPDADAVLPTTFAELLDVCGGEPVDVRVVRAPD